MAFRLFSTRFIAHQGLSSSSETITVPQGHVYVVKQLTFYSNPLLGPARADFRDVGSGATLFAAGTNAGTPGWFGFYGALTFLAGEAFQWEAHVQPTDAVDVYAGGYDLLAD